MCAPIWEMLVKKGELNPQKLAFSSGYGPSTLTTANNDRSQVWFRSQPPSQVSQQPKFLSKLSWIKAAVLADSRSTSSRQATTTPGSRRSSWSSHFVSSMKSFSMSIRPILCRMPPPSPSSRKRMPRPRLSLDSLSAMNIWSMSVGPNPLLKCGWPFKNVFQRTSLLNKLAARRRFYTVSMADGES
jgi:hypothetical protein